MNSITSNPSSNSCLDWNQRPQDVQEAITYAFNKRVGLTSSGWGMFNGSVGYDMCRIDEQRLLKGIILKETSRKNFTVLEIGAGEFQWGKALAKFIEAQTDLPGQFHVTIFSIRAESIAGATDGLTEEQTEHCTLYNIGAFKSENLFAEFKKRNFQLENQVDIVLSRWCFRHLADPVGTFVQTIGLLRPETGFFLGDGFFFLYDNETMEKKKKPNRKMIQLLLDSKAPFLMVECSYSRSLNQFVLQRLNNLPCQLPMSYAGQEIVDEGRWQIGSEHVTTFKRTPQGSDHLNMNMPRANSSIYGDRELFNQIKSLNVFCEDLKCIPIHRREGLNDGDLHKAVANDNVDLFQECLENNFYIDQGNSEHLTPLGIAFESKNVKMFERLLQSGARDFRNIFPGKTPLQIASALDTEGHFIEMLIKAKANIKGYDSQTPLDLAIGAKNAKAVEILIKNHAKPSKENFISLKDKLFSSVHKTLGIEERDEIEEKPHGLAEVIELISQGHCVVLHYNGEETSSIMYFQRDVENAHRNAVYININPKFDLLNEGEWPGFIKDAGYTHSPYDSDKINDYKFDKVLMHTFGYSL